MYNYLAGHPLCVPALQKEVHFFDYNYSRGIHWYRAHFPTALNLYVNRKSEDGKPVTGEATPYYMFHPHAPERIADAIPEVKLIALLRNPVDRAYSHYQHERRLGREELSFEEAVDRESERLDGEVERMLTDPAYYSYNHQNFSYLSRGIYVVQLAEWLKYFPRERILIIKSEDFDRDTEEVFQEVQGFLGIPETTIESYEKYNYAEYTEMGDELRKRLNDFYRPYNDELNEMLDLDIRWF